MAKISMVYQREEDSNLSASDHPIMLDKKGIGDFSELRGEALSTKAAKGFLSRAEAGTLRFPKVF